MHCNACPDGLHDTERPRALQEPIDRRSEAPARERKHEGRRAIFERVKYEGGNHGEETK